MNIYHLKLTHRPYIHITLRTHLEFFENDKFAIDNAFFGSAYVFPSLSSFSLFLSSFSF